MTDPYIQMELLQKGIESEEPDAEIPEEMTKEKTMEIVKEANDASFDKYKDIHVEVMKKDLMLTPVVISCLSHDYIF